jgi:hypothetical protein
MNGQSRIEFAELGAGFKKKRIVLGSSAGKAKEGGRASLLRAGGR